MDKWQECDCGFADSKGGYESCPECGATFREEPAAVDGWRLVVHQSEGDTKPAVWATDGDSFVWVADLAASREVRDGGV